MLILRVFRTLPVPLQSWQGLVMICPRPPHLGQAEEVTICPKGVFWARVICPEPWQLPQTDGAVPGLAPLPWQVEQFSVRGTSMVGSRPDAGGPSAPRVPSRGPRALAYG